MKLLARVLVAGVLVAAGAIAWIAHDANHAIYHPDRKLARTPRAVSLDFRDVRFNSSDGVALHGWYMPHRHARFTLLHLHGNAGNISHRLRLYQRWHALGLSVFAFDYRGFGRSAGAPSETGFKADAAAAWHWLVHARGLPPERIIIAGRRLGCALAAGLADDVQPAGLALEAPFTSIPDLTAARYPWLPLHRFVRSRFNTLDATGRTCAPLLLISARDDKIIPAGMGARIFNAHHGPGRLAVLAGGHNDFDVVSRRRYFRLWQEWINTLPTPNAPPPHWTRRSMPSPGSRET